MARLTWLAIARRLLKCSAACSLIAENPNTFETQLDHHRGCAYTSKLRRSSSAAR